MKLFNLLIIILHLITQNVNPDVESIQPERCWCQFDPHFAGVVVPVEVTEVHGHVGLALLDERE